MRKHPFAWTTALLLTAAAFSPAGAQPAAPPAPPEPPLPPAYNLVQDLDRDGDGAVSREEFTAGDAFAKLDRNADGLLDAQDFHVHHMRFGRGSLPGGALLGAADEDGDHSLTKAQWRAFLHQADADRSGKLEMGELSELMPTPPTPPAPPSPPGAPRAPMPPGGYERLPATPEALRAPLPPGPPGAPFGPPPGVGFGPGERAFTAPRVRRAPPVPPTLDELEQSFERFDANGDGVVAGDEWPDMLIFRRDLR
jgi:hypothetical protein